MINRVTVTFFLFILAGGSAAADTPEPNIKEQLVVCSSLLSEISGLSTSIKIHGQSLAWNAEDRKKATTASQKDKLYESSNQHNKEKQSDYQALASIVSIYKSLNCGDAALLHELYCPEGWSNKCK